MSKKMLKPNCSYAFDIRQIRFCKIVLVITKPLLTVFSYLHYQSKDELIF